MSFNAINKNIKTTQKVIGNNSKNEENELNFHKKSTSKWGEVGKRNEKLKWMKKSKIWKNARGKKNENERNFSYFFSNSSFS